MMAHSVAMRITVFYINVAQALPLFFSYPLLVPSHIISYDLTSNHSANLPSTSPLITVSNSHKSYVGLIDLSRKFLLIVSITSLHFTRRIQ